MVLENASADVSPSICYRIRPAVPEAHLLCVELSLQNLPKGDISLSMPAWIPGSYMIRDFAKNVVRLRATGADGQALDVAKLDKQTWVIRGVSARATVEYWVYAWDLSVRGAHFDPTHAYFNGPSVFLSVRGEEDAPCHAEILPPPGLAIDRWRVATTLPRDGAEPLGFGRYYAQGYEHLIDHPVEMGTFDLVEFTVRDVPHRVAITGRHRCDEERLARDLARICEYQARLFGDLPVEQYLFLVTAVGEGYGGLEHSDSCSVLCKRDELPQYGEEKVNEGYRRFLALCSHEYFHLWHVKRIRPLAFVGADLTREVHTGLLWAFEGITSYYDELCLVRSGCIDERSYMELLAQNITRVMRTPGRNVQSLAESSFDAWTKLYKPDENAPNAMVSYYAKGALVALALDLTIRQGTDGERSLDDVMRALWLGYGKTGHGVPEDGVEALAMEVTGTDLEDFFAQAVRGTDDIDLVPLFEQIGIGMRLRPRLNGADQGGVVDRFESVSPQKTFGVRLDETQSDAIVMNAFTGGPAMSAGISAGDRILAIDRIRATRANFDGLVGSIPDGEVVPVHLFRRDELMELQVRPDAASCDTCELRILDDAPDAARHRRLAWLGVGAGA